MEITLRAPAKVNLGLWVKGLRPDGYHEIETVLIPIGLWDELKLSTHLKSIEVICDHPRVPSGAANLAYQAAQIFYEQTGLPPGVEIRLKKGIPVGAGLGGGSSDAAATLLGLNQLYQKPLSTDLLLELGERVGADVPFFILGRAAYARGKGEILEPIKAPECWIVLHIPKFSISTRWAYSQISGLTEGEPRGILLKERLEVADWAGVKELAKNSFEDLIFGLHPELYRIKEQFLGWGAWAASLSGTGSAVYALVGEEKREKFIRRMKEASIDVICTRTLREWGVV